MAQNGRSGNRGDNSSSRVPACYLVSGEIFNAQADPNRVRVKNCLLGIGQDRTKLVHHLVVRNPFELPGFDLLDTAGDHGVELLFRFVRDGINHKAPLQGREL